MVDALGRPSKPIERRPERPDLRLQVARMAALQGGGGSRQAAEEVSREAYGREWPLKPCSMAWTMIHI